MQTQPQRPDLLCAKHNKTTLPPYESEPMSRMVKEILAGPIQMADQVSKMAEEAQNYRQECEEVKAKAEKLAGLLREAARKKKPLYERPTRRIVNDIQQVLHKAITLLTKCRSNALLKLLFTVIPATSFRKTSMQLDNSLADMQWLLRLSASDYDDDHDYLGLPPIAASEPILCLIWEHIAILLSGCSLEERSDAAAALVSLARDNHRYGRLILEEGGVPPLLKLLKEGKTEGQENAARALGLLGKDSESVEGIVKAGVCKVFAKILKQGDIKVQIVVAWAISELASRHLKCQHHFSQNNVIRLLISHLAFETIEEKFSHVSRDIEDPVTKEEMKAMAARSLWQLCKGNLTVCRRIAESRGLVCLAVLLEKGCHSQQVRLCSALALMEITAVAENHSQLRRSAFNPTCPAARAVVERLLEIIDKADSDLLIPCVIAFGNLARTVRATETRFIAPLVRLLNQTEPPVSMQAAIALTKFARTDNYLHQTHCNAIIEAGGAKHLVQLVYFGDQMVQIPSLTLLCYVALHVPKSDILAQQEVLLVLKWCTKQAHLIGQPSIEALLPEAKTRLELYQSRVGGGFR